MLFFIDAKKITQSNVSLFMLEHYAVLHRNHLDYIIEHAVWLSTRTICHYLSTRTACCFLV